MGLCIVSATPFPFEVLLLWRELWIVSAAALVGTSSCLVNDLCDIPKQIESYNGEILNTVGCKKKAERIHRKITY